MEDFHDTKISKVDGIIVGLFGVFDGQYLLPAKELSYTLPSEFVVCQYIGLSSAVLYHAIELCFEYL